MDKIRHGEIQRKLEIRSEEDNMDICEGKKGKAIPVTGHGGP
jgi:hypothetical protein